LEELERLAILSGGVAANWFRQLSTEVWQRSSLHILDIDRLPNVEDRGCASFTELPWSRSLLVENT
jgi:hypothetical protein